MAAPAAHGGENPYGIVAALQQGGIIAQIFHPDLAVDETQHLWSDEEFLPLADQKPRIAAYKERKAKASACLDREWSKHDPDGRAGDYDVVEYDSRGNVKKVERMSDRIMRKVEPVCKLNALEKERDAIREELRKEAEAESAKAIEKVETRFAKK